MKEWAGKKISKEKVKVRFKTSFDCLPLDKKCLAGDEDYIPESLISDLMQAGHIELVDEPVKKTPPRETATAKGKRETR